MNLPEIEEENTKKDSMRLKTPLLQKEDRDESLDVFGKEQFLHSALQPKSKRPNMTSIYTPSRRQKKQKRIAVITGQSGFDIDELFGFEREELAGSRKITLARRFTRLFGQQALERESEGDLFDKLPASFAYYIIIQSIVLGSIIVPWSCTINLDPMLKLSWRFSITALILVPFVLYEKRTISEDLKYCYTYEYIFAKENIQLLFLSSLHTSVWNAVNCFCCQFTYIANVILFSGMTNFWFSVSRIWDSQKSHFVEHGGRWMCAIGMVVICVDCYFLESSPLPADIHDYASDLVFMKPPWQRVFIGNMLPIIFCGLMVELRKITDDVKHYYPPFLSMFIISIFTVFNSISLSYFVEGTFISFHQFYGWFSIITDGFFTGFLYMQIVINFSLFITMFDPIIPATSVLSESFFTMLLLQMIGVQHMPSSISIIGYVMIIPGQFIILLGEHIIQKEEELKEYQKKKSSPGKIESTPLKSELATPLRALRKESQTHSNLKKVSTKLQTATKKSKVSFKT